MANCRLCRVWKVNRRCPVAAFNKYVGACETAGVKLRNGYLFAPTASPLPLSVQNAALSSTNTTKRLRLYLPDEDLTSHGSRAGAAITLLMLGTSKEAVMEHCRWASAEVLSLQEARARSSS